MEKTAAKRKKELSKTKRGKVTKKIVDSDSEDSVDMVLSDNSDDDMNWAERDETVRIS